MGDLKLFRIDKNGGEVQELEGHSVALEKSLQNLIERHLETFLGVTFLASEYSTGKVHKGRIDTLGIDENGFPVVIEYKAAVNENVVTQGLFYLDWLLDHQAEFELLVLKKLGKETSDKIDWSAPRLLCIAGDFNKYDEHAVRQINRNVELIRYERFGSELLLFELVNATSAAPVPPPPGASPKTPTQLLEQAKPGLQDLFAALNAFLLGLGDDVQFKANKYYFVFRRFRNFVCAEVHPQSEKLLVFVKVDPDTVTLEPGFTRDVRKIGHFGTGDLEITVKSLADFEKSKPLLLNSYEAS